MRRDEWKALGLPGLENVGAINLAKEKKSEAITKAQKYAEQRRATQVRRAVNCSDRSLTVP